MVRVLNLLAGSSV